METTKQYPENWEKIAKEMKAAAQWHCRKCGDQCYKPGEKAINRLKVLGVHHRDGNTQHNWDANLLPLCTDCHFKLHGFELIKQREFKRQVGIEFNKIPKIIKENFLIQWTQEACNHPIKKEKKIA
jgi:hypothetical protein